jgi:hypothetical protein
MWRGWRSLLFLSLVSRWPRQFTVVRRRSVLSVAIGSVELALKHFRFHIDSSCDPGRNVSVLKRPRCSAMVLVMGGEPCSS